MPSYVIKPSRDEDFYVYWSDIVEAPVAWGSHAEVLEHLEFHADGRETGDHTPSARMDRADITGCSAMWPSVGHPIYGWNDDTLIYQQQGILRRGNLRELSSVPAVTPKPV